jgi:hypothetical protein
VGEKSARRWTGKKRPDEDSIPGIGVCAVYGWGIGILQDPSGADAVEHQEVGFVPG